VNVKMLAAGGACVLMAAAPAHPQDVSEPAPPGAPQRFQVRIMEGVLENAVQHGAQTVSTQIRLISPDVALFSGPARARGFRLEGYGLFFAVDVPALHRSLTWSVRTLTQSNGDLARAIQSIRRMVQAQHDARMKTELEQALRLVEVQVGPPLPASGVPAGPVIAQAASGSPEGSGAPTGPIETEPVPERVPAIIANPSATYTQAVKDALVDAMIQYGTTLGLSDGEWLTVAARENSDSILAGDLSETVTVTLRVKASDLEAYKAGTLTQEETRRRVEVGQF
jgi:hypothetical protein